MINGISVPINMLGLYNPSSLQSVIPSSILAYHSFIYVWLLDNVAEMMRQANMAGKTSSPKDRALHRQRERTRFASPS